MEGRSAIQKDGMSLGNFVKDVPDLGRLALNEFLRAAHGVDVALLLEASDDERLKENEGHLLRQAALIKFELGTDHDDRPPRVIPPFAQEVLTESSALALEHVAERFERTVGGAGDRAAMASVVEKRVHGLLKHALLVADDDFRSLKLQERL